MEEIEIKMFLDFLEKSNVNKKKIKNVVSFFEKIALTIDFNKVSYYGFSVSGNYPFDVYKKIRQKRKNLKKKFFFKLV